MEFPRACGILLHPTSLPSRFGIGDLGQAAYAFVDFLEESGAKLWQVLPLGHTSYGDSPYFCVSAFAGNPLLVSPEMLVEDGLLDEADLTDVPDFPVNRVDYGWVIDYKFKLLRKSFDYFQKQGESRLRDQFFRFTEDPATHWWMDDFTLFMAIKAKHDGKSWLEWEDKYRRRDPRTMEHIRQAEEETIEFQKYMQYLFFRQWTAVRNYAHEKGIQIIGDIPIFVAMDSADTWANPDLFYFDSDLHPTVVAGVPPDYFSQTGQLWGNPLYRWDVNEQHGYYWWIERFKMAFAMYDRIRIDHFRGFEAYWEIPAGAETAVEGRWVKGPNERLFFAVQQVLGDLPIIAEDLGVITPEVECLRDMFDFPGMKILQFAFDGDPHNAYLPHNHVQNCVVYTGTHDNETMMGWFKSLPASDQQYVLEYLNPKTKKDLHWHFVRSALASVADTVIIPLQDLLGLGSSARMNTPSIEKGNWRWRFTEDKLTKPLATRLKKLVTLYGR